MTMKVLQIVGYKNSGKTTLVCEIVKRLSGNSLLVGTIKRDAHDADPEPDGTDTRMHREAGAGLTVLASDSLTQWVRTKPTPLHGLLAAMETEGADPVIVEGFKHAPYPKLVLTRGDKDIDLLALRGIIGIVMQDTFPAVEVAAAAAGLPVFRTGNFQFGPLIEFLCTYWRQKGT